MKFACFWLLGAIVGYALGGTIEAALIAGAIAFYGYALLLAAGAALSELARTKRQLTALREAVEEVLERWDDSEPREATYRRLQRALASLDEQEGER